MVKQVERLSSIQAWSRLVCRAGRNIFSATAETGSALAFLAAHSRRVLIFAGDASITLSEQAVRYKLARVYGCRLIQRRSRTPNMSEVEGFILAGGASSRMGTDKARLVLDGRTFIERIAGALRAITPDISVVSARPESLGLNLPVVPDIYRECGALGGLHGALQACRKPWAAVVSCDLPFVTGELFARLDDLSSEDADAVVPHQLDGRPQPLCALYSRAACLELAGRLLREGERRPRALLRQVRTRRVAPAELADLPDAELFFLNVNTPEDYRDARERARVRL